MKILYARLEGRLAIRNPQIPSLCGEYGRCALISHSPQLIHSFCLILHLTLKFFVSTKDPKQRQVHTKKKRKKVVWLQGFRQGDSQKGCRRERETLRVPENSNSFALLLMDVSQWTIHLWCSLIKMSSSQVKAKRESGLLISCPGKCMFVRNSRMVQQIERSLLHHC